ncbi:phosphonate ABC transporter, permease protein PhnE [Culicoidibacter larvae]|uniref:phosphonate ABC transporter, permease protein PhnE n=1 Tax=Culicoidibacter larvae TaxID=2579976 RepID=UPI0024115F02|nr:phosphonate ABC transporter, permease protein PhnE [Culicoidibacter larvae]
MSQLTYHANKTKQRLIIIFIVVIFLICMYMLEFNPIQFLIALPEFIYFLFFKFFPPSFNEITKYIPPILDTIYAAVISTFISTILGLLLAFLLAKKTSPFPLVSLLLRSFLSLFRNIPLLIWAAILTIVFGIGITAGIIALIIFTTSFLARVLSEAIDDIGNEVFEAVAFTGATKIQVIKHGVIPSFMPSFYSWTLFLLEINIKASSILGLVGAGGLGYELKKSLDLFQYNNASALVLIMGIIMLTIEFVSNRIRSSLI